MTVTYIEDATYHRMLDTILDNVGGKLAAHVRDQLMFAIGEGANVWPESSREEPE